MATSDGSASGAAGGGSDGPLGPPGRPFAAGSPAAHARPGTRRGWDAAAEGDARRARDRALDFDASTEMLATAVAAETGEPLERVREVVRVTRPPRRVPLLVQGLAAAGVAALLAAAGALGVVPLAVALLALQVVLVLGALSLLDAPSSGAAFVVAAVAAVAADVTVVLDDGDVDGLAGVAALALVAALFAQLLRRRRARVTEALADTLLCVVLVTAAACLLALRELDGGEQVLPAALAAAGVALLVGRVGDRFAPHPALAVGATRGWPGLLLALAGGTAAGALVAQAQDAVGTAQGASLGLVCAAAVAAGDLAVDLGAAELRAGFRHGRRVAALRPVGTLLPFALLAPVALVAGRLVLT